MRTRDPIITKCPPPNPPTNQTTTNIASPNFKITTQQKIQIHLSPSHPFPPRLLHDLQSNYPTTATMRFFFFKKKETMYKPTMCHDVLIIISHAANRPFNRPPIHLTHRDEKEKRKKRKKFRTKPDQTRRDEKKVK